MNKEKKTDKMIESIANVLNYLDDSEADIMLGGFEAMRSKIVSGLEDLDKQVIDVVNDNERMHRELDSWGKMLELHGINSDRMSAALSFAFADNDSCAWYLKRILSLSDWDLKWYEDTHGIPLMPCQCGCEEEE